MESRNLTLSFCYACMQRLENGESVCPSCGYNNAAASNPVDALPQGTALAGKYLVGKVIVKAGSEISYIGYDLNHCQKVLIREYFPDGGYCFRSDSFDVIDGYEYVDVEQFRSCFYNGYIAFLDEGKMLASMYSPYLFPRVRDSFDEHHTAYIVMDCFEGRALTTVMQENGGRIEAERVVNLMLPLIEQLDRLHERNIIHRAIEPNNILFMNDRWGEHLALKIDYWIASFDSKNLDKSLTIPIMNSPFAPLEQYSRKMQQGAYTDVYSLCATMYYAISGEVPPSAIERFADDARIKPFHELALQVPQRIENAIMHGLALKREDRTQTMKQLLDELTA